MNILFVMDPSPFGGAAVALVLLTKELVSKGHRVTVCTSRTPDLDKKLEHNGVTVINCRHVPAMITASAYLPKTIVKILVFGGRRMFGSQKKALKIIQNQIDFSNIDIVHTNSARSDLGCMIARKYHIPHIIHFREFGIEDLECIYLKKNYIKYLNSSADYMIAVSDAARNNWISRGMDEKRIATVYDGIDTKMIISRNSDFSSEQLHLVITGGITSFKGQHICIEAIHCLSDIIRPNVTLDIIGWQDPKYRKRLNAMINSYKLQNQVHFLGKKDSVNDLLCQYDIGLMTSKSEAFGLVTVEYMAAGLGVIASCAGANTELISDGENGLLFERDSAEELADCITKLYNNRNYLKKLALCGRNTVLNKFTAQQNADSICHIYNIILKNDSE